MPTGPRGSHMATKQVFHGRNAEQGDKIPSHSKTNFVHTRKRETMRKRQETSERAADAMARTCSDRSFAWWTSTAIVRPLPPPLLPPDKHQLENPNPVSTVAGVQLRPKKDHPEPSLDSEE